MKDKKPQKGNTNRPVSKQQTEDQMLKRMEQRKEQLMEQRMAQRRAERAEQRKAEQVKKEKMATRQKRINLAVLIAFGAVVILSLLFLAAQAIGNVTFSRISDGIVQTFSNLRPGPGYPVSVGKNTVLRTETFGENLVLLEKDRLVLLNSTAKEMVNYPHTYSAPRLSVSNSRVLMADNKTGRYALFNASGVVYEGDLTNEIYCCAVGNSGDYAFSTKSTISASLVSFYSAKDNRKLFDFKCADEYIIGISLSPNGKKAALIGVGTKDAIDYSKLYIIPLNEKKNTSEKIREFTFDGVRLHTVFCSDNDTVITAFKNGYSVIKNEKNRKDKLLDGSSISHFAVDTNGSFAFAVNGYSDDAGSTICAFNNKGNELYSADLACKVDYFDFCDNRAALAGSDGKAYLISSGRTKKPKNKEISITTEAIAVINKNVFVLQGGTIEKLKF